MRLIQYLDNQPKLAVVSLGLSVALILGVVDYLTGPELSFSIFYSLPISLVTWLTNKRGGVALSILSAGLWLAADLGSGHLYSHPFIPYWNMITRAGVFLIVTYTLSALRASIQWQEELMHLIVHDLRAPLSNILTGLDLVREIAEDLGETGQQEIVATCLSSGYRMLTLINSLLDLGRLEKGKMPLALSEIDVREMVQDALDQVSLWAERGNIALTWQIEEAVRTVYADTVVTTNILVNLLGNALKFSQPDTKVTISVAPAGANMVAFSISDQGPGVPKEWLDRIFNRFTQVETRKRGIVGTGLGLSFCRLAVEAQGGCIWMNSQLGQGTTVTFTLPGQANTPKR